jgi:hypothetical protein
MALTVDDTVIAEVQARVTRAHHAEALTAPLTPTRTDDASGSADGDPRPVAGDDSPVAPVATATPPRRRQPRPAKRPTTAERIARAVAKSPTATPAQLAARLELSERTVQRYLNRSDDTVTTPPTPTLALSAA